MLSNYSIELCIKNDYFVKVVKIKNTYIAVFPKNLNLNLTDLYVYYTVKPYGVLIKTNSFRKKIECAKSVVSLFISLSVIQYAQNRILDYKLIRSDKNTSKIFEVTKEGEVLINAIKTKGPPPPGLEKEYEFLMKGIK